ncbi:uncharacterized protein LOC122866993 isoform X2 [Siniperca chuatsi]|uniref:uncharacterized protein LOC122866993 isoform X2 n=1 Tax=Siniperca chuatsi TaxID=119488 RepID=UPI001CE113B7|nr:uncharacterized protein LOC122866993 isoform X2 [Siniperca chuatsi]
MMDSKYVQLLKYNFEIYLVTLWRGPSPRLGSTGSANNCKRDRHGADANQTVPTGSQSPSLPAPGSGDGERPSWGHNALCSHSEKPHCCSFLITPLSQQHASASDVIIPFSTPFSANPTQTSILDCFTPISLQDLVDLVGSMKPSSSPVDILPTSMLKNVLGSIGPCLMSIINSFLQSGCVPAYFKTAVVLPLRKKTNLDPPLPKN